MFGVMWAREESYVSELTCIMGWSWVFSVCAWGQAKM